MNHLKTIAISAFAAMTASVISCENKDNPSNPETGIAAISVQSREFEGISGLKMDFKSGDRIGIFAVKDNAADPEITNLCLTASVKGDGTIEWVSDNPEKTLDDGRLRYFAYYPYSETLKGDINPAAEDAAGFFEGIIAGIPNSSDQSSEELFRMAAFMTASGKMSDDTLVFDMSHNMALAVFELPTTTYKFDNTERQFTDYINSMAVTYNDITPFRNTAGTAVFAYNPQKAFSASGKYADDKCQDTEWEASFSGQAGTSETYKIGKGNVTVKHTLKIGDFFLANGNLISKDADRSEVQSADVIGVVFQTNPARIGQTEKDALGGEVHGLVVSVKHSKGLQDVPLRRWFMIRETEQYVRDEKEIGLKDIFVPKDPEATFKMADEDLSGYDNCLLIRSKRQSDYEKNYYPSIRAALEFDQEIGAPHSNANVSEWFLPSNGQWFDILRGLCGVRLEINDSFHTIEEDFYWENCGNIPELLNASMEKVADDQKDKFLLGDCFWTSSVATPEYSREINIADNFLANSLQLKLNGSIVRPIFVF